MPKHPRRTMRSTRQPRPLEDFLDVLGPLALGVLGLACVAGGLSPSATSPPQPRYLGIPRDVFDFVAAAQEQDMWCWAASIQMLLNYYGISIHQRDIVSRVFGFPANEPGTDAEINASLNGWGVQTSGRRFVVRSSIVNGVPQPSVLYQELSSRRPVLLAFNPGCSVGHAVVVTGVSLLNGVITSLIYRDPWPTQQNVANKGRVELFTDDLAAFLPSVRAHWLVAVQQV